jgi:hypothetical protein
MNGFGSGESLSRSITSRLRLRTLPGKAKKIKFAVKRAQMSTGYKIAEKDGLYYLGSAEKVKHLKGKQ